MATITVTPNPATTSAVAVISFTGANGGWVEIEGPTAHSFISSGTGNGEVNWWPPAPGSWLVVLTDGKSKKKFNPPHLAETTVEVTG